MKIEIEKKVQYLNLVLRLTFTVKRIHHILQRYQTCARSDEGDPAAAAAGLVTSSHTLGMRRILEQLWMNVKDGSGGSLPYTCLPAWLTWSSYGFGSDFEAVFNISSCSLAIVFFFTSFYSSSYHLWKGF